MPDYVKQHVERCIDFK